MASPFSRFEDNLILALCMADPAAHAAVFPPEHADVDWRYIEEVSDRHRVTARVFSNAIELHPAARTAKAVSRTAKTAILREIHDAAVHRNELDRILRQLAGRGIDCVLMKGLSLDASGLRHSGDIDILVEPGQAVRAIEAVLEIPGYRSEETVPPCHSRRWLYRGSLPEEARVRIRRTSSWRHAFHLYKEELNLLLEIHINLFTRSHHGFDRTENIDCLLDGAGRLREASRHDRTLGCRTLRPEHALLLMCLHTSLKRSPANNTFRLSTVHDIASLSASGVDWDFFLRECIDLKVAPFILFSLLTARRLLNARIPRGLLGELKSRCTGLQLSLTRLHLRCISSLRKNSHLYRGLYQSLGPFAFGGSFSNRLQGALFMPLWLPPYWKASQDSRGSSMRTLRYYLESPVRVMAAAVRKGLSIGQGRDG